MKFLFLALMATVAMATSVGHADQCEHGICAGHQNGNDQGRPDYHPGPGPGPGWGHGPDHGPGWGHPGYPPPPPPPPHYYPPQPPPYYPPAPTVDWVECDSDGYRTNTCYYNNFRVSNVMFYQQRSNSACVPGQSYGIMQGQIWVSNGCRALFRVDHY